MTPLMNFEIISEITEIETIAVGQKIRDVARLRRKFGPGRWRKLKGIARVRLRSGRIRLAELHWYEAPRNWAQGDETKAVLRLTP